jgi:hypothetical protein
MTGKTSARNQTQQALGTLIGDRVTNAAVGLYTCTARTRLTAMSMTLSAVGADATYAIAIKRGVDYIPIGAFVDVGINKISVLQGSMMLEVGDIITNVGDSGSTNGTCDISANIEELG